MAAPPARGNDPWAALRLPFVALAFLTLAAIGARADDLSDDKIIHDFDVVAFRNEMYRLPDPRVHKWIGPVRVFVREDTPLDRSAARILDGHLKRLADLTGVDIDTVAQDSDANFIIVFTTRDRYVETALEALGRAPPEHHDAVARRLPTTNCVGLYQLDEKSGRMLKATVVIPLDHARAVGRVRRCIVEETTQSMGLPNDDNEVYPSIFNDSSRLDDLTEHDILLLRLLYDPRMKAGMKREEALAVAREILPELRR
jgi:Protein of unknown function (DUF2927)